MKRPEVLARAGVIILALAGAGIPLLAWTSTPLVHARTAGNGGWMPDVLRASVGQPIHLRLTSDDVVHGFAVGQMSNPNVEILPGKVTDVTLQFDRPGTYVFYCTRWCGIDHWRMRGTIEVTGSSTPTETADPPLYIRLGLDLDAVRAAAVLPLRKPTAALPLNSRAAVPEALLARDYYQSHSPEQTWASLRQVPALSTLADQQRWDMTATIWSSNVTPAGLAEGAELFKQNCAACHGQGGAGDGVFASQLAAANPALVGMGTRKPADFTDASRMLAASPALLQGKILRGGMGTGMPSWGPIFTDSETWDLVAYLYTFQFTYP